MERSLGITTHKRTRIYFLGIPRTIRMFGNPAAEEKLHAEEEFDNSMDKYCHEGDNFEAKSNLGANKRVSLTQLFHILIYGLFLIYIFLLLLFGKNPTYSAKLINNTNK